MPEEIKKKLGTKIENELCRVCEDPAAGFHFGVFTCEGCKSFFGRTYQKKSLAECKKKGACAINRSTRTKCKLCRLKKCFAVGMSKEASRYGRRSTYFKVHCMNEKSSSKNELIDKTSEEPSNSTTPVNFTPNLPSPFTRNGASSSATSFGEAMLSKPVPLYRFGFNPFLYASAMMRLGTLPTVRKNAPDNISSWWQQQRVISPARNLNASTSSAMNSSGSSSTSLSPSPNCSSISSDASDMPKHEMHQNQHGPLDLSVKKLKTGR